MNIGDIVVRRSYDKDISFKIIDIKENNNKRTYLLKGINVRIIADSNEEDLERVEENYLGEQDKILNRKVSKVVNKAIGARNTSLKRNIAESEKKNIKYDDKYFGRPGKIGENRRSV